MATRQKVNRFCHKINIFLSKYYKTNIFSPREPAQGRLYCTNFRPVFFGFSLSRTYEKTLNLPPRTRRERCPQRSAVQMKGSRNDSKEDEIENPLQIQIFSFTQGIPAYKCVAGGVRVLPEDFFYLSASLSERRGRRSLRGLYRLFPCAPQKVGSAAEAS